MRSLVRAVVAFVAGICTFFFSFWAVFGLLFGTGRLRWFGPLAALGAGAAVGRYVWRHSATMTGSLATYVVMGAILTGTAGFAAGFFGPLIFLPGANQGPLLGLFFTGPLGFVLGAIGGGVYWKTRIARTQP